MYSKTLTLLLCQKRTTKKEYRGDRCVAVFMKKTFLVLLTVLLLLPVFAPRAQAIDPVTMMVLAPVAIKAAEVARPYVVKSLIGTGTGLMKVGKDAFHMLYLPYGLLEMTIGAPFKKFHSGVVHVIRGGVVAPIRLILHSLLLPLYMVGANVNI